MAYLAKSLARMREQANVAFPDRSKISDGWIGDPQHAARKSEHNPGPRGEVRALDLTHDPKNGFDSYKFAEHLRAKADKRILYIISNGRIANPGKPWRKYTGSNPHSKHVHISVVADPKLYDDASEWSLPFEKPGLIARAIAAIKEYISPTPPAPLKAGSKGEEVKELQRLLGVAVDGDFGPFTEKAVRAFQKQAGLAVDGIVGAYTLEALKKEKTKPVDLFDKVMVWVFEDEGGVTLSQDEPGGISVYGVSRTAFSEYRGRPVSIEEMKSLTKAAAFVFYREKFWNVIAPDKPAGFRYAAFDWAINSGPRLALEYVPQARNADELCDMRIAYLKTLPGWSKYGKGWTNRVNRVRARAKTLG